MGKKILVVDDEPIIVETLQIKLTEKGYEVYTANNGKQALQEARSKKPDLIIMDVRMPKMDGFEALKQLKKDKQTMNIPVIMLTGETDRESMEEGMRSFADKYLNKPVNVDQILTEVEKTLSSRFWM